MDEQLNDREAIIARYADGRISWRLRWLGCLRGNSISLAHCACWPVDVDLLSVNRAISERDVIFNS
jgi:Fe2+ transport system protein FeoA